MMSKFHYFFLLKLSPWPLISSLNAFSIMLSFLLFIKFSLSFCFIFNIMNIIMSCFFWWFTYSGEFNLEGKNSSVLEKGLKFSMLLFISSEIFFFFSFFWSYFHFFLSPTLESGLIWPPYGINMFDCLNIPLINTMILLTSGVTVTMSHHYLISGKKDNSNKFLISTILLGLIFTSFQIMEYFSSFFSISDSTFGTSFFILTGFHGIHVLIGTLFLMITLYRFTKMISSKNDCLSFEMASWYWHFVDVVWIFLYFFLYYMNN